MKKVIICLRSALAHCSPPHWRLRMSNGIAVMPDNGIENVRMVCDETGRCWQQRGQRRVVSRIPAIMPAWSGRAGGIKPEQGELIHIRSLAIRLRPPALAA